MAAAPSSSMAAAHRDLIRELEDEGRGLDWQAIRRKCKLMHLPSRSRAERLEGCSPKACPRLSRSPIYPAVA